MEIVAETPSGPIKGQRRDGTFVFRGIPYARAPIGELRFAPPVRREDLASEGRPFDATKARAAPPQNAFLGGIELPGLTVRETDEDCLYLNIWTDGLDGANRPVMVWIHGGGFTTGSGSLPVYKGQRLAAEHKVVVVTINYRLGILGFLHLGLEFEDIYPACTNLGIADQICALEWIRDNIASFGGDPNNVTVFGESAGAMSIGALMGTPGADRTFQRAILQSGAAHFVLDTEPARKLCLDVLERFGLDRSDIGRLRDVEVDEILKVQLHFESTGAGEMDERRGFLSFLPVKDGRFLISNPLERVRSGQAPRTPVIVGSTLEEFKLFATRDPSMGSLTKDKVVRRIQVILGDDRSAADDVYRAYEAAAARRGSSTDANELWLSIAADGIFRIPAIRLAEACIEAGRPVFVYLFGWKTPLLGAAHGVDVPFVFGNLGGRAAEPFIGPADKAERLSRAIREAWTSFATEGRPSATEIADWPQYDTESRPVLVLDENPHVEFDPFGDERRVWEGLW